MFFISRSALFIILGSVLGTIADSVELKAASHTEVVKSQITPPPSFPSLNKLEKRTATDVTCSEWSVEKNGISFWFTCAGGVNTCILGSSTPYWHCGLPEAPATWYTSCYDFPATSHPGNNNYCQQARPYCATWSIITNSYTYSTFGCDTTPGGDKTLIPIPTATSPGSLTTISNPSQSTEESGGIQDHIGGIISSRTNLAAAIAGTLLGFVTALLLSLGIWWFMLKKEEEKARGQVELVEINEGADLSDSEEKISGIEVTIVELKEKDMWP